MPFLPSLWRLLGCFCLLLVVDHFQRVDEQRVPHKRLRVVADGEDAVEVHRREEGELVADGRRDPFFPLGASLEEGSAGNGALFTVEGIQLEGEFLA